MGRRKKSEILEDRPCDYIGDKTFYYGDTYTCPICGNSFKFTEDHKYIAKNSFTCSWKCFLVAATSHPTTNKKIKKETVSLGQLLKEKAEQVQEEPIQEEPETISEEPSVPEKPKKPEIVKPKKSCLVNLWE